MSEPITSGLRPGDAFQERYQIIRCIKAGGMGAVYEVLDSKTASRRALKVMLPSLISNEALRARFELEAKITGSIESDHLVRVLDAGVDAPTQMPFLVMELLRGDDLGALLQQRGSFSPEEVVLYVTQVARALDKTHAASVVHRDLKPENLFLTFRDDDTPCVKVLDFGIAKAADMSLPGIQTRPMMGTPLYMSPEQMRAEVVGAPTDIYALGHIAYALLTGEPYWKAELDDCPSPFILAGEVMQGVSERPTVRAKRRRDIDLPAELDLWFLTAVARKPAERFARASLAAQALADALQVTRPSRVPPAPAPAAASSAPAPTTNDQLVAPPVSPAPPLPNFTPTNDPATIREPSREFITNEVSPPEKTGVRPVQATAPRRNVSSGSIPVAQKTPASTAKSDATPEPPRTGVGLKKKGFVVDVDLVRAIVRVKVWGFWTVEDGQAYLEEFKRKASRVMGRSWYVLADISEFTAQKPEVGAYVEQTMAFAVQNGMVRAANLVSSSLGKMQIARLSQAMGLPEFSFFQDERLAIEWLTDSAA